ncbi:hypothetical protein EJ06DRAFT_533100 [Trichodelitschia bisporula]|uniref:Pre-mRNA-splicing factor SLU7 n=1 Tax=Trichodelitschia bisporula TaxID=703511 RepID=A0A6G1HNQ8_9PEZI|nr:hypothetical protein EJ06DRAFT_533100 [Trichodelitschia bisporula]
MGPPPPRKPDATPKDRNEYIPAFIAQKPFYVPDSGPDSADYLEHQRLQQTHSTSSQTWYDRGAKRGPAATKFRKGACTNCGAMTHKAKECLSRPRKLGAKWTGKDIQADEIVQDVQLGWDAKRDRWNGYDPAEYEGVVQEYNELEALKRERAKALGEDDNDDPDKRNKEADGDRYEEEATMGRTQSSARALRLREDTAKYLLNLDLESAKYDPKTRSMADAGAVADEAARLVAEEDFVRRSGDAAEFDKAQRYAWETQERGGSEKLHLQANPTSGELSRKKDLAVRSEKREAQKAALLAKYGGQEHLAKPAKDAIVVESERYVEYDERGLVKGAPKPVPKSKYPEDVLLHNHTAVWGSWWKDFVWGYACCHSTVRNSYCTGEEGRHAFDEAARMKTAAALEGAEPEEEPKAIAWRDEGAMGPPPAKEKPRKRDVEADTERRKRTLDEMRNGVTEEDMEEYRRKRTNAADPMAALLGRDEIV